MLSGIWCLSVPWWQKNYPANENWQFLARCPCWNVYVSVCVHCGRAGLCVNVDVLMAFQIIKNWKTKQEILNWIGKKHTAESEWAENNLFTKKISVTRIWILVNLAKSQLFKRILKRLIWEKGPSPSVFFTKPYWTNLYISYLFIINAIRFELLLAIWYDLYTWCPIRVYLLATRYLSLAIIPFPMRNVPFWQFSSIFHPVRVRVGLIGSLRIHFFNSIANYKENSSFGNEAAK